VNTSHVIGVFLSTFFIALFCLLYRKRIVILRHGSLTWTQKELARGVLISGDTGSGKTVSGFQPILVQLTKNLPYWGGLVLGVKGDEHRFIEELAEAHNRSHDVIHLQVRPDGESTKWQPPHRFNLLSDHSIPWMTHAKAIVDIAASMTEGKQHAFFRPIAQIALANAFTLLDELGEIVTLTKVYALLTSQEEAQAALKRYKRIVQTPKQQKLANFFESNFVQSRAPEQKEAIKGTITTYMSFFLDPDIENVFSSEEPNTFSFNQIEQGAIITLTMPQRMLSERRYVQTYLKILFYLHTLRRFDKTPEQRKQENFLLLVADEFQDIVTASEDGISDHKIIDRIRSANAAIIAGMQSEISADPAIGQTKRKVLTLNMRTRLIFKAAEHEGATLSAEFIGKKEIWKTTKTSSGYDRTSYTKRKEEEYKIKPTKLMSLGDHVAIIVHPSKKWIKKKIAPLNGKGKVYGWY